MRDAGACRYPRRAQAAARTLGNYDGEELVPLSSKDSGAVKERDVAREKVWRSGRPRNGRP